MKTTSLFVELIVIGIGALSWLLLLLFCVAPFNFEALWQSFVNQEIVTAIILLSFIYLLGIITDRIADSAFAKPTERIRRSVYLDRDDILPDKILIYNEASPLVDMIDYGRNRMRICRGWLLNTFLIIPSWNLFLSQSQGIQISIWVYSNLLLLGLLIGLFFAWKNLTYKEYEKIKEISQLLK